MVSFFLLIDLILGLYVWVLIIAAVLSWLIAFNVINPYNQVVSTINDMAIRLTEPVLAYVRRVVPRMGGLDLSPVLLILLIVFIRNLLREYGPL